MEDFFALYFHLWNKSIYFTLLSNHPLNLGPLINTGVDHLGKLMQEAIIQVIIGALIQHIWYTVLHYSDNHPDL